MEYPALWFFSPENNPKSPTLNPRSNDIGHLGPDIGIPTVNILHHTVKMLVA